MENLTISLESLANLSHKLTVAESTFLTSSDMSIKYEISYKIIDKLSNIITELTLSDDDLSKHSSTLRYILETLITSDLLLKEEDYFLKLYYSIYVQQVNKTKAMLFRLKNEILVLKEYATSYKTEIASLEEKYASNPILLDIKSEEIFQAYKKTLQNDIYIFLNQLEEYGFDFLLEQLEKVILPQYIKKVEEYINLKEEKAKELMSKEYFKKYFSVGHQYSKVFKLLEDKRSWSQKAEVVGLNEEYKINYETTSSLLHFTSYSLLTANTIDQEEKEYNYMIINQYVKKICTNISALSKAMLLDIFNIIHVK